MTATLARPTATHPTGTLAHPAATPGHHAVVAPRISTTHGVPRRTAPRREPALRRPERSGSPAPHRAAGTVCAAPAVDRGVIRRRRAVAGVMAGAGLAVVVWAMALFGGNYAASTTPAPVDTTVVHVRQGESLSAVAARVAPDMPTAMVVDAIVGLNDLETSGLVTGQALLAPEYR